MHYALVATSSLLVVLLALGWAKEFRLRRALQNLLTRIFTRWRDPDETEPTGPPHRDARRPANTGDRRRMQ